MTDRFNLICQQLLQKDFSTCSIEELQLLAQEYPFFAPAQFLLLKKLQEGNTPAYAEQFQKVALYHNNPLAFDLLINDQEYNTVFPAELINVQELTPVPAPIEASSPATTEIPTESVVENKKEEVQATSPLLTSNSTNAPLSFEPYHTVDYFASVGIKLSHNEATKDNFGRQLKSFTEWLKTMKRLPAAEQLKKLDPHAEEKVENIAAHSLDNSEILTETMAEVWVKQGKLEKAIEVYNKLSLLNPSKRAYFAAKLENLKKAI